MKLSDFLCYLEFDYDITSKNEIRLIDLQGADLGEIEEDRFPIDANIMQNLIERLDCYINDYIFPDFEDVLDDRNIEWGDMELKEMIEKCKELGIEDVCYDMAEAVVNPNLIELDKQLYIKHEELEDYKPKFCNYKWIDFLSHTNVVEIKNYTDFSKFKAFLEQHDLIDLLRDSLYFDRFLEQIGHSPFNKPECLWLDYSNHKGISWWDNKEEVIEYFGDEPIKVDELFEGYYEVKDLENDTKNEKELNFID